jgi:hypothetical protein
VLEQVVAVGLLEDPQEKSGERGVAAAVRGPVPGDLEVDQVGIAVVSEEDVFTFFEINIGDATGMDVGQEGGESREKLVAGLIVFLQRVAGHVLVNEGGVSDVSEEWGDAFNGADGLI